MDENRAIFCVLFVVPSGCSVTTGSAFNYHRNQLLPYSVTSAINVFNQSAKSMYSRKSCLAALLMQFGNYLRICAVIGVRKVLSSLSSVLRSFEPFHRFDFSNEKRTNTEYNVFEENYLNPQSAYAVVSSQYYKGLNSPPFAPNN